MPGKALQLGGDNQREAAADAVAAGQQNARYRRWSPYAPADDEAPGRRRMKQSAPIWPLCRFERDQAIADPLVEFSLQTRANCCRDEIAMRRQFPEEADRIGLQPRLGAGERFVHRQTRRTAPGS